MEKFLNDRKNNVISEEIGGSYKVINAWGPWGKKWSHGIYGFLCDVFMF